MIPLWTPEELVAASGGHFCNAPSVAIGGISIDSRTLQPGDAFVAIAGEHNDGYDYLESAFAAGASCAIIDRAPGAFAGYPCLLVEHVESALRDMAVYARERATGATRIAITGSVGKTSVKEFLAGGLSALGATHRNVASYNNQWGVPLSLARMPRDTEYAIFEIGTNSAGEISPLSRLVRPRLAHITTIAPAHLSGFASFEALAEEKSSIFDGLTSGGIAVIHRDQPHYALALEVANERDAMRVISFGQHRTANVRVVDYTMTRSGGDATAQSDEQDAATAPPLSATEQLSSTGSKMCFDVYGAHIPMQSRAIGRHNATNIAGVLAIGLALGVDMQRFIAGVAAVEPVHRRSELLRLELPHGGAYLINDSYNANPASMEAAIKLLAERGGGARTVAVLGDMLELGTHSDSWHAAVSGHLISSHISKVFAAGGYMSAMWELLPPDMQGVYAANVEDLIEPVTSYIRPGDVILVKGSRGSMAYRIADALMEHFSTSSAGTDQRVSTDLCTFRR